MDLEFPRSGSHCEQEKHSQERAMGKAPPEQHSQPRRCLIAQPGIPGCSHKDMAALPLRRGAGQRLGCPGCPISWKGCSVW